MRTPKGTRAFYSEKAEKRRLLRERIEDTVRSYGFKKIQTPSLEEAQVYADKSGEEIVDQLFSLDEKIGDEKLVLTPELTPTIGKMVSSKKQKLKEPIKWYNTQKFWRYEEPQQGRFREFWQTNIDIFGGEEPIPETELLCLSVRIFSEIGIKKDQMSIKISDRRILENLIREFSEDNNTEEIMKIVDKKRKLEQEDFKYKLKENGMNNVERFIEILEINKITELEEKTDLDIESIKILFREINNLNLEEWIELDLSVSRGVDYYTGIVFEGFDETGAINRSILGGGRYDNLTQMYGGEDTPASGMAIGYAPLEEALDEYGLLEEGNSIDLYVIRFEETSDKTAEISESLRGKGYSVESPVKERSISSQFSLADSRGASYVIVPGPTEISKGKVTVKNLETGAENKVNIQNIEEEIDNV